MNLLYWLANHPWPEDRSNVESIIPNVTKVKLIAGNESITIEQGDHCFVIHSDRPIENVVQYKTEIH